MHYREIYECGHIGRSCYCEPHPPIQPMMGVCPDCEAYLAKERPDFDTLHGLALEQIALNRRSGVPEVAVAWMVYDWLHSLIHYNVANADVVHGVMLVLEDDKAMEKDALGAARRKVLDAAPR